jgi:hypothetical protein
MSGFKSLGRSCPICEGARRDCRENLNTGFIHCRDASANPGGQWRYIKDDAHGFGMWVWDEGGGGTDNRANRPTYAPKAPSAPAVLAWPVEGRDKGYRAMAGALALAHRVEILKRPLVTKSEVDALVSAGVLLTWKGGQTIPGAHLGLPGVRPDGRLAAWHTWAVAAHDLHGRIIGIQYRNDRNPDEGKYKWASGWGGASVRVDDELPITVLGTSQDGVMNLAEGIGLKPALGWLRYGALWVGAAGGNFASSPKQLRAIINAHGITQAVLNADGGAIQNRQVMTAYRGLAELLEDWGIPLKVRWWGQTTKADGDVDEVAPEVFHGAELLSWAEFEAMAPASEPRKPGRASWAERLADRLTQRPTPQASAKAFKATLGDTPYTGHEYEPGQRLAIWKDAVAKGFKYILDQSGTGQGKSYDAGLAQPEDFEAKQLLYFSANHYDPATKTLADWPDLHGRHNGLTRDTMPDGSTKLRRAKRDEQRVVPANCGRTDLIGVLRAKNIQGADQANVVCRTCPLLDACQHAAGYGYGFLHQRKTALASPRLRLHPDSAPGDDFGYSDAVGVWEEFGASLKMHKEITILPADVDATMARLVSVGGLDGLDVFPIVRPFLASLRALFAAKQGRYGVGHEAAVAALATLSQEQLETLPEDLRNILKPDLTDLLDPELEDGLRVSDLPGRGVALGHERINLRSRLGVEDGADLAESQVLKQWLPDLLRMLATGKGSLRVNFDTITLTVPTFRHRGIMAGMKSNILLDATLTPEDAALMLGCEVDDIFVCRQRPAPVGNLKITQIADLGKLGMQRGEEQARRLAALVSHLKATQNALVIDFKKYQADGAWWADSRGSNAFQGTTTLVLAGTPCQNLGALEAEYRALLGNLDGFEDWVNRKIHADILQGIGRLRANRRPGEQLHLVFISPFELDIPNITQVAAKDFTIKAASKLEKTEMAIRAAVAHLKETGAKMTQSAIAKAAKVSQGYLSRRFGKLLLLLLGDSYSKSNNSEVDDPPPELPPLVWGAIDLADTPQMLVDTIADLLNGLVDPHHLLAILLSGPPSSEPAG